MTTDPLNLDAIRVSSFHDKDAFDWLVNECERLGVRETALTAALTRIIKTDPWNDDSTAVTFGRLRNAIAAARGVLND